MMAVAFVRGTYAWEYLGEGAEAPLPYRYTEAPRPELEPSLEELRALKQTWFDEATRNDELVYLQDLATMAGERVQTREGPTHLWEAETDDGRTVRVVAPAEPEGTDRLRVLLDDRVVCDTGRGLFVPGAWLQTTRGALGEVEQAREAQQQAELATLRRELGLAREPPGPALAWLW